MSNIHPCPFCKSDDVAVFGRLWGGEINDGIRCASCGAEADIYLWDELANHIRDLEAQLERVRPALRMAGHLAIDERWDQRFPKVFGEMEAALQSAAGSGSNQPEVDNPKPEG